MRIRLQTGGRLFPPFVALLVSALFLVFSSWVAAKPLLATHVLPTCDEAGFDTALNAAQIDAGVGIVAFPGGCTGELALTASKSIYTDVVIDGGGVITLTVSPGQRHFFVDGGADLFLRDIALVGGSANSPGGSIYVAGGDLQLQRVTFAQNESVNSWGGAIYADEANLRIMKGIFLGNEGAQSGGALFAVESSVWISDSFFLANTLSYTGTANSGGAVYTRDGKVTQIVNSTFANNRARTGWGGALWVQNGPLNIARSVFADNRAGSPTEAAQSQGGALFVNSVEPLRLLNSTFSGNYSAARGGALYAQDSQLLIARTTFLSNTTDWHGMDGQGGAIYAGGVLTQSRVISSTFLDNVASYSGGAIFNSLSNDEAPLSIEASTFAYNRGQVEGAALRYFKIGAPTSLSVAIENSTFYSNTGTTSPTDAIRLSRVPLALNHVTLAGAGKGLLMSEADASIRNSILTGANGSCGAISANIVMTWSASNDNDCHFGGSDNLNLLVALSALHDNGGSTLTMLPSLLSPVVDVIPAGQCLPTDQRGVARPQGANCDMGAVELSPTDPAATPTPTFTPDPSETPSETPPETPTSTPDGSPTATPTATSTSPATQTAVAATATALATLTPQISPSPSITPEAPNVYLNPISNP